MKSDQSAVLAGLPAHALALALLAMVPDAKAEIIEVGWTASGRFERSVSVAPGKFVEVCDKLPAGAKVR